MDTNTASVLKSLIEMGSLAAIFWAAAFSIRWQGMTVLVDDEIDEEDKTPDIDDDDDEDPPGMHIIGQDETFDDEIKEEQQARCPMVERCPYRSEMQMLVGLESTPLRHMVMWFLLIGVGSAALGFGTGALLVRTATGW